ncbi:t-SNARE Vti1p [Trichomonascus vanleenenianus]|uniref:v-SNARE protein VTI1 n=1 Tax=Trichomonascus vanleenenianus TaxID=2268995 RepID=UPI003ECA37FC
MSDSTELFTQYEGDFQLTWSEIQQKLEEIPSLGTKQQRAGAVQAVDRAVDEAYEILDQLSIEVQNIASASRGKYNSRLREYRAQVAGAKRQLKEAEAEADRKALFGDRPGTPQGNNVADDASDQRSQLLGGQASLERSSQRLRDSQRVAHETEAVGATILSDLRGQREQIVNSRDVLMEADGFVDKSMRTIRTMTRRMTTNRIITIAIITILIALILLVLASKFW